MVSSATAGSGLPIGLMPGAFPSDQASRQTLNTTATRLPFGHCHAMSLRLFSARCYRPLEREFGKRQALSQTEGDMPARLKVFQAHLGFFDTVVAAPSRAAGLKAGAWRQNLFRGGQARPASDSAAITAALAKPGIVLRRPIGTNGPFSENPSLRQVPKAPKKAPEKQKPAQKPSHAAGKPRAGPIARTARPDG